MAISKDHFVKFNTWGDTPADGAARKSEVWYNRDTATTVANQTAAGYFNLVRDFIQEGDIIIAFGSDGFRILIVADIPDDVADDVTVTNKAAA